MAVPFPTKSTLMTPPPEPTTPLTVRVTVVEWLRVPLVPVTVSVGLPVGVLLLVCTVKVALPEPVTEVGLNVPVAPLGNPLTLKLTAPVKPFSAPTFTV